MVLLADKVDIFTAQRARRVAEPHSAPARFSLPALAGRFVELSSAAERANAALSLACELLYQAQLQGEPAAWVTRPETLFFAPDAAAWGLDLRAVAIARVPSAAAQMKAADTLLRSGAFAVVVLDWGRAPPPALAWQSRLAALAQKHRSALVCLTEKAAEVDSLSALVSLRLESTCERAAPGRFRAVLRALKDKRTAPGWTHEEAFDVPPGLR